MDAFSLAQPYYYCILANRSANLAYHLELFQFLVYGSKKHCTVIKRLAGPVRLLLDLLFWAGGRLWMRGGGQAVLMAALKHRMSGAVRDSFRRVGATEPEA